VLKPVLAAITAATLLGVGAASAAEAPAAPGAPQTGQLYERTELYFGSGKPDGGEVTPEEFDTFVDKEITPAFPDGLTRLTGEGQWRGSSGEVVKERSYVIILLYPVTDHGAQGEIEEIRQDYKRFFDQESVLRADSMQRVSF
jgi:Protein of unknown function (DUF3574)